MAEKHKMEVGKRNIERAKKAETKKNTTGKFPKEIAAMKKREKSLTGPTGKKKTTAGKLTMKQAKKK